MEIIKLILSNHYLNVGVLSWFTAQTLKMILTLLTTRELNLERWMGNGGMPSSHSAFTVSIAVTVARIIGFSSVEFALAFAFSVIVMTDAMGVRRAAGEHAKTLNQIIFEFADIPKLLGLDSAKSASVEVPLDELEAHENKKNDLDEDESLNALRNSKLKEFLGHTPIEVLGGLILGLIMGFVIPLPRP